MAPPLPSKHPVQKKNEMMKVELTRKDKTSHLENLSIRVSGKSGRFSLGNFHFFGRHKSRDNVKKYVSSSFQKKTRSELRGTASTRPP